jgi:hypothetical protein
MKAWLVSIVVTVVMFVAIILVAFYGKAFELYLVEKGVENARILANSFIFASDMVLLLTLKLTRKVARWHGKRLRDY